MDMYRPMVFGLTMLGALASHPGGDYPVQSDWCARLKQQQTPEGRRALAAHGATYGATQVVTKGAVFAAAGVRVPVLAQLAGSAVEALLHVVIDDGRLLAWFADATGKRVFHDLGAPRQITGAVDIDGVIHPVRLVEAKVDDGRRIPAPQLDAEGELIEAAATWDNPNPSTGRALMDQALHTWLQVPVGAAVTAAVACWLRRR